MGMWISCQTRTDISFDVCHVAPNLKNSTLAHIKHLNSHISSKRIKIFSLTCQYLGEISKLKLVVYADVAHGNAAYADAANGVRQEGYLIFLVDEDSKCIC